MNDEELERRLRDEIQRRVSPPNRAPYALRRQVEMLGMLEPVRGTRIATRSVWQVGLLAAAAAIVALVAMAAPWRQPIPEVAESPATPPGGVQMFGRIDAATAWAVNSESVYVTGDDGATWTVGRLPNADGVPGSRLGYPVFADAKHGWAASWSSDGGYTTLSVHSTADGGRTWQTATLDGSFEPSPVIGAIDRSHAWLVVAPAPGSDRAVFTTADGGATWRQVSTVLSTMTVQFVSPSEAWAFDDGLSGALTNHGLLPVWHSVDGGATWSKPSLSVPPACTTLLRVNVPADDGAGWLEFQAACATTSTFGGGAPATPGDSADVRFETGALLLTYGSYDEGATWLLIGSTDLFRLGSLRAELLDAPYRRWRVLVPDRSRAVPLIVENDGGTPFLKATFDAGRTWTAYPVTGVPGTPVLGAWVSQDDVWIAVDPQDGGGLRVYATRDRGLTWRSLFGQARS